MSNALPPMPPIRTGQRWERVGCGGIPESLTIGARVQGPWPSSSAWGMGFEVFYTNAGQSSFMPCIHPAALETSILAEGARLVAGPYAPWEPKDARHAVWPTDAVAASTASVAPAASEEDTHDEDHDGDHTDGHDRT